MVAWGHQVHIRGSSAVLAIGRTAIVFGISDEATGTAALIQTLTQAVVGRSVLYAESLSGFKLVCACSGLMRDRQGLAKKEMWVLEQP